MDAMDKSIVLVLPPTPFLAGKENKIPLGICYVFSVLKLVGFKVEVLDLTDDDNWQKIIAKLKSAIQCCNLVGFTGTSAHNFFLKKAARLVKVFNPSSKTILGGPVAIAEPEIAKFFDLTIAGHIESLNPDILIQNSGLFQPPPLPVNLDLISKPTRNILLNRGNGKLPIITSRFCPFSCTFCYNSLREKKEALKRHSVERVIEEIEDCLNLGSNDLSFQDDTFILNKGWLINLCKKIISNDYRLAFNCRARVDKIDKTILKHLQKAGCASISYGIESGSQKMLDIMNKGTTPALNTLALKLTKDAGIKTKAYFLLGIPGEDEGTVYESMKWLECNVKYIDKLYLYMWIPYPGSKLYQQKDQSFKIIKSNFCQYSELLGSAMYRSFGEDRAMISTTSLPAYELEEYFYKIKKDYSDLTKFE